MADRLRRGLMKRLLRHGVFEPMALVFAEVSYPSGQLNLPVLLPTLDHARKILDAELQTSRRPESEENLALALFGISARHLAMGVYGLEASAWYEQPAAASRPSPTYVQPTALPISGETTSPPPVTASISPFMEAVVAGLKAILNEGSDPRGMELRDNLEAVSVLICGGETLVFVISDGVLFSITVLGDEQGNGRAMPENSTGFAVVEGEPVSTCIAAAETIIRRMEEIAEDESRTLELRAILGAEAAKARIIASYMLASLEQTAAAPDALENLRTAVNRLGTVHRSLHSQDEPPDLVSTSNEVTPDDEGPREMLDGLAEALNILFVDWDAQVLDGGSLGPCVDVTLHQGERILWHVENGELRRIEAQAEAGRITSMGRSQPTGITLEDMGSGVVMAVYSATNYLMSRYLEAESDSGAPASLRIAAAAALPPLRKKFNLS